MPLKLRPYGAIEICLLLLLLLLLLFPPSVNFVQPQSSEKCVVMWQLGLNHEHDNSENAESHRES